MNEKKRWDARSLVWLTLGLAALLAALFLGQNAGGKTMTEEEKRVAQVLSAIAGAGKVEVALFYAPQSGGLGTDGKTPTGAVAVAQGAGNMEVRLSLIRAMRTLLSLPETAVDVFKMEEGR